MAISLGIYPIFRQTQMGLNFHEISMKSQMDSDRKPKVLDSDEDRWCRHGGFHQWEKAWMAPLMEKIWNIPNFFFRTWSFIHQNADSSGKKWHSIDGRIVGTWRKPYCSNKPWNNTKSRKMLIRGDIGKAHVIWYGVIWYDVNNPLWSPKWSCWVLWLLVALPCFCSAGKSVFVESQHGPGPSWICLYI